jgi:hypothetical protein
MAETGDEDGKNVSMYQNDRMFVLQVDLLHSGIISAVSNKLAAIQLGAPEMEATHSALLQVAATLATHSAAIRAEMTKFPYIHFSRALLEAFHTTHTAQSQPGALPVTTAGAALKKAAKSGADEVSGPPAGCLEAALRMQASLCLSSQACCAEASKGHMRPYISALHHPDKCVPLRDMQAIAVLLHSRDAMTGLLQVSLGV